MFHYLDEVETLDDVETDDDVDTLVIKPGKSITIIHLTLESYLTS